MSRKPRHIIDRERARKAETRRSVWLFGLHAVRDALLNPRREKRRLVVTPNAARKLAEAIAVAGIEPELVDPRRFSVPLDPGSVHQGAALEVAPLDWGGLDAVLFGRKTEADGGADLHPAPSGMPSAPPLVVLLDRVTDPHNVGAILRSAEVFGADAVIATARHAPPETGALAKAASGALERQPYLRVRNLADTIERLRAAGFVVLGLDGTAQVALEDAVTEVAERPLAIVLGAEGPGLRQRTRETVDRLVRITPAGGFGSLNVSNAAAVALHAADWLRRVRGTGGGDANDRGSGGAAAAGRKPSIGQDH